MATITHLSNIDLAGNEMQNIRVHNLASAPTSPEKGRIYFDTTMNLLRVWNGTSWVAVGDTASDTALFDGEAPAFYLSRTNHTDTQAIATVTGLQSALDDKADDVHDHSAGQITSGVLDTARGGTGAGSAASGLFMRTGTGGVFTYMNASSFRSALAAYSTAQVDSLLDDKQDTSEKNAANGYAGLNASGLLSPSVLPDLAITQTHVVADLTARNALTVQEGDVAVVNDADPDTDPGEPATYIYTGSAWTRLKSPQGEPAAHTHGTDDVTSGTLPVERGGTGRTSMASGDFLRGNGTGAVGLSSVSQVRTVLDVLTDGEIGTLLDDKQDTSEKNAANGYAGLDASTLLDPALLGDGSVGDRILDDTAQGVVRVLDADSIAESAQPDAWPLGTSLMNIDDNYEYPNQNGDWPGYGYYGYVLTHRFDQYNVAADETQPRVIQHFFNTSSHDGEPDHAGGTGQASTMYWRLANRLTSWRGPGWQRAIADWEIDDLRDEIDERTYTQTVNPTTFNPLFVDHGLDTRNVHVTVYRDSSPWDEVMVQSRRVTTDRVELHFASTPNEDFICVVSR